MECGKAGIYSYEQTPDHFTITNTRVYITLSCAARLPDQWYRYKFQDIHELSGRDHMILRVPSETVSWLVWTLGGGYNLLDRLRLNVAYF